MKKLSELQKELGSIRKRLFDGPRPNGLFLMSDSPTHCGAPHVEIIGEEYHFVVTERGSEFERRRTKEPDELLYWFVSGDVSQLAQDWELERRVEGKDSRRLWFAKEVEMLRTLRPDWARRKELYQNSVLKEHPFNDNI